LAVWSWLSIHRVADAIAILSLLKVMVMLEDTPECFTAELALHSTKLAEIATRGRQLRAQLPSYLEQQQASIVTHCPLPTVLQLLVAEYAVVVPEDMWTDGLRVKAPRAKRVRRAPKAKHFEEEVEEDDEVAPLPRRSQRLRQKRG
jgi:hypothetical protein